MNKSTTRPKMILKIKFYFLSCPFSFQGRKMGKHYWSMVTYGQFVNWLKAGTFEAALYLAVGFVSMSVRVGGLMVSFDCMSGWLVGLQTVAFKALQWSLQGNRRSKLLLKLKSTNKCSQCTAAV